MKHTVHTFAATWCVTVVFALTSCDRSGSPGRIRESLEMTKAQLAEKIKGGWAGQAIGCTYGGPTEFRYNGTMIQDDTPIYWDSLSMEWWYDNAPGLYDDLYMDLTFVDVFERKGLEAPVAEHAKAFAEAGYNLWHANQAARYNILNGTPPPASGYWENNPHSDDIDFQIEADFAGLMSPGMVGTATTICDSIGHIMNYGDGWYGGVFVASMYALAFRYDVPAVIVEEALKSIPEQSTFHQCINDVIRWHAHYPGDWKRTWFEVQKKWSSETGCPKGVFSAFDIDAKINSAYVVIGLLYGNGDFGKSIEISTRCGEDSDCNPSTVGGILGTVLGYGGIPHEWKRALVPVEDKDFSYTTMSLNDVYSASLRHALENISRNGGSFSGDTVRIRLQEIEAVRLEQGFANCRPAGFREMHRMGTLSGRNDEMTVEFDGTGFVVTGGATKNMAGAPDMILEVEVTVDGALTEVAKLPTDFTHRRYDITWKYNLDPGQHVLKMKLRNPREGYQVRPDRLLIYDRMK